MTKKRVAVSWGMLVLCLGLAQSGLADTSLENNELYNDFYAQVKEANEWVKSTSNKIQLLRKKGTSVAAIQLEGQLEEAVKPTKQLVSESVPALAAYREAVQARIQAGSDASKLTA